MPASSIGDRTIKLDFSRTGDQPFLLATLPVFGEVLRLPMRVESSVVRVRFVQDELLGILRGTMHAIHCALWLVTPHSAGLLPQQRSQLIPFVRRRPHFCYDRDC